MAIDLTATPQATTEIRTHYVDFTKDLPDGVTVASATAGTVTFPTSGTAGLSVGAVSANVVPLTVTYPSPAGDYTVSLTATLSDAEKIVAYVHIPVVWKDTRDGMDYLIADLRALTDTGYDDYRIAGVPYWSDKHLQDYLDRHRVDFYEEDLTSIQQYRNGTTYYQEYLSSYRNLEGVASGTGVFKLDNSGGTNIPGTMWSADYYSGRITFVNDTAGSSMLLTGRSYDINAAAAEVWRVKAANAAKMYNFSAGGQSFQRAQFMQNCLSMAQYYEGMAEPTNIRLYRSDNQEVSLDD